MLQVTFTAGSESTRLEGELTDTEMHLRNKSEKKNVDFVWEILNQEYWQAILTEDFYFFF